LEDAAGSLKVECDAIFAQSVAIDERRSVGHVSVRDEEMVSRYTEEAYACSQLHRFRRGLMGR
jgi:hypothetical protein